MFVFGFGPFSKKAVMKRRKGESISICWRSGIVLDTFDASSSEPHNYSVRCFSIVSTLQLKKDSEKVAEGHT